MKNPPASAASKAGLTVMILPLYKMRSGCVVWPSAAATGRQARPNAKTRRPMIRERRALSELCF